MSSPWDLLIKYSKTFQPTLLETFNVLFFPGCESGFILGVHFLKLGNTSSLLNFKRIKERGEKINHHNPGEREERSNRSKFGISQRALIWNFTFKFWIKEVSGRERFYRKFSLSSHSVEEWTRGQWWLVNDTNEFRKWTF